MNFDPKLLVGLLIVGIGGYIIYMSQRDATKGTVESNHKKTRELIDERFNQLSNQTKLNPKILDERLKILFGDDYSNVIADDESFNELQSKLENGYTLFDVLNENTQLKKKLSRLKISNHNNFRQVIEQLLINLKYSSAREKMEQYILENPGLDRKQLAEIKLFISLTISARDDNLEERSKYVEEAYELDDQNPNIIQAYAKNLSVFSRYTEAIDVGKRNLVLANKGLQVDNGIMSLTCMNISDAIYELEILKPETAQDFDEAKHFLNLALDYAKKEKQEGGILEFTVRREMAKIEGFIGNEDKVIEIVEGVLSDLSTNEPYQSSYFGLDQYTNNLAFCYKYLGLAYLYKFRKSRDKKYLTMSEDAHRKSLDYFIVLYGENDSTVASQLQNLAPLVMNRDFNEAVSLLKKAIAIYEASKFKYPIDSGKAYFNLALLYFDKNLKAESLFYANKALEHYKGVLPNDHTEMQKVIGLIIALQ